MSQNKSKKFVGKVVLGVAGMMLCGPALAASANAKPAISTQQRNAIQKLDVKSDLSIAKKVIDTINSIISKLPKDGRDGANQALNDYLLGKDKNLKDINPLHVGLDQAGKNLEYDGGYDAVWNVLLKIPYQEQVGEKIGYNDGSLNFSKSILKNGFAGYREGYNKGYQKGQVLYHNAYDAGKLAALKDTGFHNGGTTTGIAYHLAYSKGYFDNLFNVEKQAKAAGQADGLSGKEYSPMYTSTRYKYGYGQGYYPAKANYNRDFQNGAIAGAKDAQSNKPAIDTSSQSQGYKDGYNKGYHQNEVIDNSPKAGNSYDTGVVEAENNAIKAGKASANNNFGYKDANYQPPKPIWILNKQQITMYNQFYDEAYGYQAGLNDGMNKNDAHQNQVTGKHFTDNYAQGQADAKAKLARNIKPFDGNQAHSINSDNQAEQTGMNAGKSSAKNNFGYKDANYQPPKAQKGWFGIVKNKHEIEMYNQGYDEGFGYEAGWSDAEKGTTEHLAGKENWNHFAKAYKQGQTDEQSAFAKYEHDLATAKHDAENNNQAKDNQADQNSVAANKTDQNNDQPEKPANDDQSKVDNNKNNQPEKTTDSDNKQAADNNDENKQPAKPVIDDSKTIISNDKSEQAGIIAGRLSAKNNFAYKDANYQQPAEQKGWFGVIKNKQEIEMYNRGYDEGFGYEAGLLDTQKGTTEHFQNWNHFASAYKQAQQYVQSILGKN